MAIIPIDIISDVICPWCFIGYRTLQKAISLYRKTYPGASKDEFRIEWKPYFIDQVPPEDSLLVNDRMSRRMKPSQVLAAQTRLKRVGKSVGIEFRFGGSIGSSRLAHRALYFAFQNEGSEIQCALAEVLFKYQFEMERDVSLLDVLVEAAVEAELDESVVREYLEGEGGKEEVEEEQRRARDMGIKGVPCFVVGDGAAKEMIDGAGDMEEFFGAFVKARGSA
ncbi:thioredoxin-like protein [Aspergillus multicolor]|uniref:DsbA family oxidoreductase n=1 Tax=Aspergillus multicolor TaxID=41759 RepID=UPI003CCDDE1A